MENRIKIRHGSGIPTIENLQPFELGLGNINGLNLLVSNSGAGIQPFGWLWGTSTPEEFFKDINNIPNGTFYLHIKSRE